MPQIDVQAAAVLVLKAAHARDCAQAAPCFCSCSTKKPDFLCHALHKERHRLVLDAQWSSKEAERRSVERRNGAVARLARLRFSLVETSSCPQIMQIIASLSG